MDEPRNVAEGVERQRNIFATVAGIVITVIAVIFVVQNTEDVTVDFLWLSLSMPLWVFILIMLALGAALGWIVRWRWRRRRRD